MYYNMEDDKVLVKKIQDNIDVKKYKNWKHLFSTNCYAYALGLDIREFDLMQYAYQPGVISKYKNPTYIKYFLYSTLLRCFYQDMKKLGIEVRKVNPNETIDEDEWKIALFTSKLWNNKIELLGDFHFLRQSEDGTWYHKMGYISLPSNKDNNNIIITDPTTCYLKGKEFRQCYSLKLKK